MSETLTQAGFDRRQADAIARVVVDHVGSENLVTTEQLRAEFAVPRAEFRAEISALRSEFRATHAELKADMVGWLIGSQAVLLLALVALASFARLFG